ncbi:transglycosylase SLT domain-containing protein [Streptomyces sp. NPDC058045]|uniref:transglycosylase SLT domain-containing protein n=1 Tax=Streptomyces sp. NPDC058045 TaxID=3346311 RepID=UPI0036E07BBF
MPAKGKHRRAGIRSLKRTLAVAGTGGAALVLPLVTVDTASATPSAPQVSVKHTAAHTAAAKSAGTIYAVVHGDSLSKIAHKHSVRGGWHKLYEDNRRAVGGNPNLIHPGLKLTIGGKAAAPSAGKSAPKKAESSAKAERSAAKNRANRSERRAPRTATKSKVVTAAAKTYSNNLDGWIRESLDVMAQHGIPGSYNGIYRNIIRESAGNPMAINNWDSNAAKGTPSKGLLQVIDPTFQAYHVPGTSLNSYDPVANIVAACNYAADRYGSIDNVNGPY